jgi:hypothetical protein
MLNTFKYTKQLEEAGFSRDQAEAQLQVIAEIVEGDLATKQDLDYAIERLEHRMLKMEHRMIIKICTFTAGIIGLFAALKLI